MMRMPLDVASSQVTFDVDLEQCRLDSSRAQLCNDYASDHAHQASGICEAVNVQ